MGRLFRLLREFETASLDHSFLAGRDQVALRVAD